MLLLPIIAAVFSLIRAELITPVEMGFLWTAPTEKALKSDFILIKEGLFMTIAQHPFGSAKEVCEAADMVLAEWDNPLAMGLWTRMSPAYFTDPAELAKPRRVVCAKVRQLLKNADEIPLPQDNFIQLLPNTFISKAKVSLNAAEQFCGMHGMSLGTWNNPLANLLWTASSLSINDFDQRAQHKQVICIVDVAKKEFKLVESAVFIDVTEN